MDVIGTTPPVWLAGPETTQEVSPGSAYFVISVRAAQVVFRGRAWEKARRVLVVSKVSMNHPLLGNEPAMRIDCVREIRSGHAMQLGLAQELVALTPATMDRVSVTFEYLVDKQNRFEPIVKLINDASFTSIVSLSPAVVGGVRALTKVSAKVLETFLPSEDRTPILQFSGDFNLTTGQMRAGHFAILASTDLDAPLPQDFTELQFKGGVLTWRGDPVTTWSYVVFSVDVVPRRTRDLGTGPWVALLDQAEGQAERIAENPFLPMPKREEVWNDCAEDIAQARTLLLEDPLYLRKEAREIIAEAYANLKAKVGGEGALRAPGAVLDERSRRMLEVTSDEELNLVVASYQTDAKASRKALRAMGLLPGLGP